jgi:hypothetical protein
MGSKYLVAIVALILPSIADAAPKIWPGFYLTNRDSNGIAIMYMFDKEGKLSTFPMMNGRSVGQMSGRCKATSHGFSCRYLDKTTGAVVTTKTFNTSRDGKNFTQRDTGVKACQVTAAEASLVAKGRNIRACR